MPYNGKDATTWITYKEYIYLGHKVIFKKEVTIANNTTIVLDKNISVNYFK